MRSTLHDSTVEALADFFGQPRLETGLEAASLALRKLALSK